jgi:hypothetical protein
MCTSSSPLALLLTTSFLDFSASQGSDLRGSPAGARICADAKLWKRAVDKGIEDVPRVKLEGTHEAALESVGIDVLKKYAAGQDNGGAERRVAKPGQDSRGIVRESQEIGGKEPRA